MFARGEWLHPLATVCWNAASSIPSTEARQVNPILVMPSPTIRVTTAVVSIWFGVPPASPIMCESCAL